MFLRKLISNRAIAIHLLLFYIIKLIITSINNMSVIMSNVINTNLFMWTSWSCFFKVLLTVIKGNVNKVQCESTIGSVSTKVLMVLHLLPLQNQPSLACVVPFQLPRQGYWGRELFILFLSGVVHGVSPIS
ncbi:hypothetical protein V8G54_036003 [Vigna mungo]|uniref:Uncharacterized protein n=1 Tax=Vigna mungo TaxID=3915 RepID=A0AAQ3MFZ5_VIGMU